jgi:hypothetical protein
MVMTTSEMTGARGLTCSDDGISFTITNLLEDNRQGPRLLDVDLLLDDLGTPD